MRYLSRLGAALAVTAVSGVLVVVGPGAAGPAAAADVADCTELNSRDTDTESAQGEGQPISALQIPAAQDLLGRDPGSGVRVAVLDSGIRTQDRQRIESRPPVYQPKAAYLQSDGFYYEGTAVAGIINGPEQDGQVIGIAPGAEVVDIPVYDVPPTTEDDGGSDDAVELSVDNVVAGLRAALAARVDIVNVSLQVEHTPQLREAVRALTRKGVIVVAASGDVPAEGSPLEDEFGAGRPGDDAAQEIFPAGYADFKGREDPLVVAATSSVPAGEDPLTYVLPSSATTVAVPTAGGISFGVNGKRCELATPSSVIAAATVSGVLALLKDRFPRENARQLVARLTATAAGPPAADPMLPNRFLGAGVVQPLEALTRPVDPTPDGKVEELAQPTTPNKPAAIDPPDADPLAEAREDAVWWALGFGGLIAVLLLLRPVIGRRRQGGLEARR